MRLESQTSGGEVVTNGEKESESRRERGKEYVSEKCPSCAIFSWKVVRRYNINHLFVTSEWRWSIQMIKLMYMILYQSIYVDCALGARGELVNWGWEGEGEKEKRKGRACISVFNKFCVKVFRVNHWDRMNGNLRFLVYSLLHRYFLAAVIQSLITSLEELKSLRGSTFV